MGAPDDTSAIRHDPLDGVPPGDPPVDHRGLRVLGFDECLERLRATTVGRLAFVSDGEAVVFPVNHGVDRVDLVFRTMWGSKLLVAETAGHVAYEIDGYDDVTRGGWSVLVKGTAEMVYDSADTDRYDALGLHSWADTASNGFWVRIRPVEVTGREILAPGGPDVGTAPSEGG